MASGAATGQALAKSSSLPQLAQDKRNVHVRIADVSGHFPTSPKKNTSPQALVPIALAGTPKLPPAFKRNLSVSALAIMSKTFSADGRSRPEFNGRHVAMGYWGLGPPRTDVFKKVVPKGSYTKQHVFEPMLAPVTNFRKMFERGDLPLKVKHGTVPGIQWTVEPERLDYTFHLPLFLEGLLEITEPFAMVAYCGVQDLITAARGQKPSLLAPCVGLTIRPIKRCLNTRDNTIMCRAINMLQAMIRADSAVGPQLVPFYRQLLPTMSLFRGFCKNLGDGIDYAQRKRESMGELVAETLELLEQTGGEDAFINIKYMIPTYESCTL